MDKPFAIIGGDAAMKKCFASFVILVSFLFLMGMGELGGSAPANKIPAPDKNFSAQATDRGGVITSLSQVSQEGKTFLLGKLGQATITIPFEKISQIQFQNLEGNEVVVKVLLREQKDIELKVDRRSKFYGKADFGTFQIEIKDLKLISFQP
jgi:hypothetical protein